ncbi:hypothetical protein [Rossellomorea sp. LjRoot5]|uniref:hypothetical protein n=1 Tax=Rossellomorea sp. LjRoot5 TaxID=3342331 RepID=UPI003ED0ABBA
MKEKVRNKAGGKVPRKEYRRRWYAPFISLGMIFILLFGFAVVKGEQWGFLGSEKLSGFFTNKSNFDVEILYDGGMKISTFSDSLTSEEGERKELTFTKQETEEIFTKVKSLDLIEEKYLSDEGNCYIQPSRSYAMKIRMNKKMYEYRYSDCNTTADAREMDELRELIIHIIKRKPGYEGLLKQKMIM